MSLRFPPCRGQHLWPGLAGSTVFLARGTRSGRYLRYFYNRPVLKQRTLTSLTRAVGVGLHSSQRVEITLRPAAPDTGIVFRRVDLPNAPDIVVSAEAVTDTRLASTLSCGNAKVHTVEHLMSACAGLGVDEHIEPVAMRVEPRNQPVELR